MRKVLSFLNGFLIGGIVGAGVVLLLAPRSGEETQQAIRERVEGLISEARRAVEERRAQLWEEYRLRKQPGASG